MTSIADEILSMIHTIAPDVEPSTVDRSEPLTDQLDLDSMDYQNLLAAMATRYSIAIPEQDVPALRSIADLEHYVQSHSTQ
ncbi:MAG TPA: acyl carrier protein [Kofleriaceae bacterium]|nr:acyl carrier protein [Kofleriaceae bacterium]